MTLRSPAIASVALALTAVVVSQAAAQSSDLFISEYVEGSSNNKALELYNGSESPIDLAAGPYNIQVFFNGSTTAGLTINLTGTVASGDVFVLAHASANGAILSVADQTTGAGLFNGDDAIALRKGSVVVDVIGQIGTDPGAEWGTGLASTADNTLQRSDSVCVGDADGINPFAVEAEWQGHASDTFDSLGSHAGKCSAEDAAPTVTTATPMDGAKGVPLDADVTVMFNEPVTLSSSWFSLLCTLSGVHAGFVTGGPLSFKVDPSGSFVSGESCTFRVHASAVSDIDEVDPADTMNEDFVLTFTPSNPCMQPSTPIYAIQGNGSSASITGSVSTTGVVVGDFEGPSPALRGFYIQDPSGDGDAATSDGIFVFNQNNNVVKPGDLVRVTGSAADFQGQTQVSASSVAICGTGSIAPVDVTLPFTMPDSVERFEGMLVRLPQTLTVTEHFQLGRFGQVVMSSGGRLRQPTNDVAPGPEALALQAANNLNRIIIDDAANNQNPDLIVFGRGTSALSASNTLRGGDTATGTVGVMTYTWAGNAASGNAYRVRPMGALGGFVAFMAANARPSYAPDVGGHVQVVGMNLLNFFNTFDGLPDTVNRCNGGVGGPAMDCRGADDAAEFSRQVAKTLAAILALAPDVIGVNEVENDGYGPESAIAQLVNELNAATAPNTYAFIDADAETSQLNALGGDAIKVGFLYKPEVVTPVGQTAVLNSEAFVNGGDSGPRSRASLAQAFKVNVNEQVFIANVNHLKSKGSPCDAPDAGDGQANCNIVRSNSARTLMSWLATDPTGTGDEDVLLIGDYNSYTMEDPIAVIRAAGFHNLLTTSEGQPYSYVFDGQWGNLDHALASSSLVPQITGAADYHINADEPSVLDYNTNFKTAAQRQSLFARDQFRASDHDPVVVGLCTPPRLSVDVTPSLLWPPNHAYVKVAPSFSQSADALTVTLVEAVSNEPDNGPDDGDTVDDIVVLDDDGLNLRAERSGTGTGRVYTLTYRATNICGATTTVKASVTVPITH